MTTVNQNQFTQSIVVGQLDLTRAGLGNPFTLRIDPDSTATSFEPGIGFQIVDGGANDPGGVPLCDVLTANTQIPFGARIYDAKIGEPVKGDIIQVSSWWDVQYMEAAAALARWAEVSLDIANPGQVKAKSTDALFGRLLDKSTAAGDIVRVLVMPAAP